MFVGDFKTPIQPDETGNLSIEFTDDMPPGSSVQSFSVNWSLVDTDVVDGATADPSPASRLSGGPQVVTFRDGVFGLRTFIVQRVANCIDGNRYRLEAVITRSDGAILSRYGHIWCRHPASSSIS